VDAVDFSLLTVLPIGINVDNTWNIPPYFADLLSTKTNRQACCGKNRMLT
jgi:hypothetical protein